MNKSEDFEEMVQDLQKKIDQDEEKTYSKQVIEEYRRPTHFGLMKNADATGKIKGSCGDTMKIDLRIKDTLIKDACFWTDGCGASIACGNMMIKMIKGTPLTHAVAVTSDDLISSLGGLPAENVHCAVLAVSTLQNAIKNYNKKK
jgi:nitrogen fixation NifU-like protein